METRISCECEHEFVLVLAGVTDLTPEVTDALFNAGCDDATASVRFGRVYLTFSRTAATLADAILSAIRNVKDAGIGAEVTRVDRCNLVTQADIARRIGRSRQQVHQYLSGERGPGNFPPPECNIVEGTPLWRWCEVAYWLWQNNLISESAVREAWEVDMINNILQTGYHKQFKPELFEEISRTMLAFSGRT